MFALPLQSVCELVLGRPKTLRYLSVVLTRRVVVSKVILRGFGRLRPVWFNAVCNVKKDRTQRRSGAMKFLVFTTAALATSSPDAETPSRGRGTGEELAFEGLTTRQSAWKHVWPAWLVDPSSREPALGWAHTSASVRGRAADGRSAFGRSGRSIRSRVEDAEHWVLVLRTTAGGYCDKSSQDQYSSSFIFMCAVAI